jgi:hypothetical protein
METSAGGPAGEALHYRIGLGDAIGGCLNHHHDLGGSRRPRCAGFATRRGDVEQHEVRRGLNATQESSQTGLVLRNQVRKQTVHLPRCNETHPFGTSHGNILRRQPLPDTARQVVPAVKPETCGGTGTRIPLIHHADRRTATRESHRHVGHQ